LLSNTYPVTRAQVCAEFLCNRRQERHVAITAALCFRYVDLRRIECQVQILHAEAGSTVKTVSQFVIGSFFASDNTCPHCNFGYQSSCQQREFVGGAQAPLLRVPLANGTLVPTPLVPSKEMIPNLLATSDVLGTGWFAADAVIDLSLNGFEGDTLGQASRRDPSSLLLPGRLIPLGLCIVIGADI
jgi:hypothetical protein